MHDSGDGVQVQSENSKSVTDIRVHHNLIYNMHWSGLGVSNYSKSELQTTEVHFWNNTVHNTKDGIWLGDVNIRRISFVNNIISGSRNYAIDNRRDLSFSAQEIFFSHNIFWPDNGEHLPGNLYQEPLFKNASIADFHLKPESPALDAGHPDPLYQGLDGSVSDLGAFPFP